MFNFNNIIRSNIKNLTPYSSARTEYTGKNAIFLDANENPFNTGYNRYPDPLQTELKKKISEIKEIPADHIFLGNGSDEAIDLITRAFCEPQQDNIMVLPPTYGMYKVSADIQNIETIEVNLTGDFQLDTDSILNAVTSQTKMIFVCSPNNPTGNTINSNDIRTLLDRFAGFVIVDEAYGDFAAVPSITKTLSDYLNRNMIVMQTFSKAWGLAGIRLGMLFASTDVVNTLNKIKLPYNLNKLTQEFAIKALQKNIAKKNTWISELVQQREILRYSLAKFGFIEKVFPSEANFFLIKVKNPLDVYTYLVNKKIIVRDRSKVALCKGCLRITVGTKQENERLIDELKNM